MRDPARIKPFMQKLAHMWQQHVPDWRFGQLMSNFLGFVVSEIHRDIFFIEDDEMLELVNKFFERKEEPNETKSCSMEVSTE